jgi:hypothetical protein
MQVKPTYEQLGNREQWLAALRSGEYKQAKHLLYIPNSGACCLGVASLIAGVPYTKATEWDEYQAMERIDDYGGVTFDYNECQSSVDLPPNEWFAERFGVSVHAADILQGYGSGLNDGENKPKYYMAHPGQHTFPEIADAMEWAFAVHDYGDFD